MPDSTENKRKLLAAELQRYHVPRLLPIKLATLVLKPGAADRAFSGRVASG
jgi:hypothetical protein